MALWITLAAGFTYLFLGFQYHDAGYSLGKAIGAGALGGLAYIVYAVPAAYLGSSTGQTHSLLARSILGRIGSALVSLLLIGIAAGWTAFAFNLLATLYDGLFSWGNVVGISVLLAVLGIANNLFGFTGIAAFARFVVAPIMVVWILFLVIKGWTDIPSAASPFAKPAPKSLRRKSGGLDLPDLTPHGRRHTAASLTIASSADVKVIQTMLGHKDASMTLDIYGHLFPDRLDEVATALDRNRRRALELAN